MKPLVIGFFKKGAQGLHAIAADSPSLQVLNNGSKLIKTGLIMLSR